MRAAAVPCLLSAETKEVSVAIAVKKRAPAKRAAKRAPAKKAVTKRAPAKRVAKRAPAKKSTRAR